MEEVEKHCRRNACTAQVDGDIFAECGAAVPRTTYTYCTRLDLVHDGGFIEWTEAEAVLPLLQYIVYARVRPHRRWVANEGGFWAFCFVSSESPVRPERPVRNAGLG